MLPLGDWSASSPRMKSSCGNSASVLARGSDQQAEALAMNLLRKLWAKSCHIGMLRPWQREAKRSRKTTL